MKQNLRRIHQRKSNVTINLCSDLKRLFKAFEDLPRRPFFLIRELDLLLIDDKIIGIIDAIDKDL